MSTATPSIEQLLDTILALPASDRAVIADAVMSSLEPPDPEVERKTIEFVRQRIAAYEAGEVVTIPGDEVFRQIDVEILGQPDPEVEQAILKLARQRLADYDSGKEQAIPVEGVLKELDEMLNEVNGR